MRIKSEVSLYHNSYLKKISDTTISILGLLFLFSLSLLITPLIKLNSDGSVFFIQKRVGKNGKIFNMYKFRTMIVNAEKLRSKYNNLNISDGPTFKIPNDPRYTKFGKYLSKSGLDELPQFINVLKGEMSIVGPRPLPLIEAKKLSKSQKVRELVLPGIISSWVTNGAHRLKFKQWMKLDREYVEHATLTTDLTILYKTAEIIFSIGLRKLIHTFFFHNSRGY